MRTGYEMTNLIERVLREAAANKEQAILAQLNDLISTGVLTVQEQAPILVRGSLSDTLEIRQMVKLSFEGAERLKALEQENTALKARIDEMRSLSADGRPASGRRQAYQLWRIPAVRGELHGVLELVV